MFACCTMDSSSRSISNWTLLLRFLLLRLLVQRCCADQNRTWALHAAASLTSKTDVMVAGTRKRNRRCALCASCPRVGLALRFAIAREFESAVQFRVIAIESDETGIAESSVFADSDSKQ